MLCQDDVAPGEFLLVQCACQFFFWTGHISSCMFMINYWSSYHQVACLPCLVLVLDLQSFGRGCGVMMALQRFASSSIDHCQTFSVFMISRGSCPRFPASLFFSENSSGNALSQKSKNLGGDMARPHTQNLASPIFHFATLSTLMTTHHNGPKIGNTIGQFLNPPAMELYILATLEHHKSPGWCSNVADFF